MSSSTSSLEIAGANAPKNGGHPPECAGGAPQELGPLNSYSRRLVHMEVSRHDDVASESQGDGQLKHVTISLRKPAR